MAKSARAISGNGATSRFAGSCLVAIIAVLPSRAISSRDQFSTAWTASATSIRLVVGLFRGSMAKAWTASHGSSAFCSAPASVVVSPMAVASVVLAANSGGPDHARRSGPRARVHHLPRDPPLGRQSRRRRVVAGGDVGALRRRRAGDARHRRRRPGQGAHQPPTDAVLDSRLCRIRRRPAVPGQSSGDGALRAGVANTHLANDVPNYPGTLARNASFVSSTNWARSSSPGAGPQSPSGGAYQLDCRRLLSAVRLLGDRRTRRSPASRWPTPSTAVGTVAIPLLPGGLALSTRPWSPHWSRPG